MPLFKFSRFFFAVFLVVTVLPLLSLLIWSSYDLTQNMSLHHKHLLDGISEDTAELYQDHLQQEIQEARRIVSYTQDKTPLHYQALLGANQVWPLNSTEAQAFIRKHPEGAFLKRQRPRVSASYIREGRTIETLLVVKPRKKGQTGFLIVKPVPLDAMRPPGPAGMDVFAGDSTRLSDLITRIEFHHRHEPPPEKGGYIPRWHTVKGYCPRHKEGYFRRPHPHEHHPHAPFPPPIFQVFKPNLSGLEKNVQIASVTNVPVVTLRIHVELMPGPPPDALMGGALEQWIGALILLTGFLSSLLAGNYIQKNFVGPLMRLSSTTRQVQEGDLSVRIETESIREPDVRKTLENFNKMLDELVDKEKLRHSFVSNLTHDLRTPLIAQTRSLELLSKEFQELNLTEQEQLAQGIVKNNEHLLTMVNQLLETYQTDAGMFKLNLQRESIPKLVTHCFEQLSTLAAERHIELTQVFSSQFPEVMIDEPYLKRVFINLIANAIQNIPKNSCVQIIGNQLTPESVEIRVRDNGQGIPKEEQKQLFDRYYAGSGDTRKLGSGLGLYICKVLIAAHQGNITVESVPGGYTDFVIHLPIESKEKA